MLKRIIALSAAILMAAALAACKGGGNTPQNGQNNLNGKAYTQQAFDGANESGLLSPAVNSAGELVTVSQQTGQPAVVTTWDGEGKKKNSVTTDVTDSVSQFALSTKDEVYLLVSPQTGYQTVHVLGADGKTAKTFALDGIETNQFIQGGMITSSDKEQTAAPSPTVDDGTTAANATSAPQATISANGNGSIPDENQIRKLMRSQIRAMQVAPDGGIYVAALGSGVMQFDASGKPVRTLGEGGMASHLAINEQGQLLVYFMGGSMGMGGGTPLLKTFDIASGKEVSSVELTGAINIQAMFYDKAGKRLLYMTDAEIKVLGSDGKAGNTLASFSEFSLLNGSRQMTGFVLDSNGTIYLAAYNPDSETSSGGNKMGGSGVTTGVAAGGPGGGSVSIGGGVMMRFGGGGSANEVIRLGLVDASTIKERKVITVAALNSSRILNQAISAFQLAHPEYRIDLKVYNTQVQGFHRGGEQFDVTSLLQALNTDLMSGKGADIIVLDSLPWYKYADKGLLLDLAQLMSDKKFDTSPYYGNVFDACKLGGKLYGIPMSFDYSLLTGSKANMPPSQNPTLADFVAKAKGLPDGKTAFARQDAMQVFYSYLRYSYTDLVDTTNRQAYFDSPEFIQAMKDFKELIGENKSSDNEQDFRAMMLDGSVAYNIESMSDPMALAMSRAILGEDMATSNVPTISGNGAGVFSASLMLGINASSKNQNAAWEFIKTMLGEEIQGTGRLQGYPVLKSAAKEMVDEMKSGTSAEGFQRRMVLRMGDKEIEVKPLSDADYNAILDKLGTLNSLQAIDPNIQKVVSEELPSFFDGQKTAEDVAALIQNRVNTVLNE